MSWESWVFPLQYWDFLHLKSDFPCTKSNLPKSAFYFLQRLFAFFNGFLTFFNGFPLSSTAFQFSSTAFRFSSTAFHFPRNPRKSIHGKKYTKDCYLSFVFFATCSLSFVIFAKQYLCLTQHYLIWFFHHFRLTEEVWSERRHSLSKSALFNEFLPNTRHWWREPPAITTD